MPYREARQERQASDDEDQELLFRPSHRDARNRLSMGVVQLFMLTIAASIGGAFAGSWGAVGALLASAIFMPSPGVLSMAADTLYFRRKTRPLVPGASVTSKPLSRSHASASS